MFPYSPITLLAGLLHASLSRLWTRLRADAHIPRQIPLTAQVYFRMTHGMSRMLWLLVRLDRLALRWQNGTLPRPRPRASAPSHPPSQQAAAPPRTRRPRQRDPSQQNWLGRHHPQARGAAGQLAHMLATEPQFRALVEAAPQAGRILRPLCRMLGTPLPDWLKLPPRRPRAPRPRPQRPQRPLRLTDPTLGLPPNIIAAARAWRKNRG